MALRLLSNRVKTTAYVLHCKTKIFGMLGPINNKNHIRSSPLFYCTKSTNPILHYYQNVKEEDYTPLDYDCDVGILTASYDSEEAKRSEKIMCYAQFAVDEHNKEKNSTLKLVNVLGAGADNYGEDYHIVLETTDADKKAYYIASVGGPGQWFSDLTSHLIPVQDPLLEEYTYYQHDSYPIGDGEGILSDLVKGVVVCMDAENDDRMKRLAHFAIDTYNEKEDVNLEFVRAIGAMTKYLNFIYYNSQFEASDVWSYITLEATDNGQQGTYRAKIWENKPMLVDELMELKLVDGE